MRNPEIIVSMAPHATAGHTIQRFMAVRALALVPALLFGLYQFGLGAAFVVAATVLGAVAVEAGLDLVGGRRQLRDGHAVVVGLLVGLMLSPVAPWWAGLIGGAAAVLVGKAPFGPLGGAPLSPAIVGLLIVAISFSSDLRQYAHPRTADDALRTADAGPAEAPAEAVLIDPSDAAELDLVHAFLGDQPGAIGAISPLLMLLGWLVLVLFRVAPWHGSLGYVLGMGVAATIGNALWPEAIPSAAFHLATGLGLFCALFLVTEPVCTPVVPRGLFLFGLCAGAFAVVLRTTALPYAPEPWALVILMLTTPLFDRMRPRAFGKVAGHA